MQEGKVPFSFIGQITGDGYIVLHDENDGSAPVNLDLEKILGDMPQKTFKLERVQPKLEPLKFPDRHYCKGRSGQSSEACLSRLKEVPYKQG